MTIYRWSSGPVLAGLALHVKTTSIYLRSSGPAPAWTISFFDSVLILRIPSQARTDIKYSFFHLRPGRSIKRLIQVKVFMGKSNIRYIIPEIQIDVLDGTKARVKRQPEHMQKIRSYKTTT
ncbi:hypothetical protein F5H01DRAFT_361471 [Linnemannia elongata]|nr:hypothetical protein F5H01DRAFT_361471 [Linnemannia elongata]